MGDLVDRTRQMDLAARQERLASPQMIQKNKAIRFPVNFPVRRARTVGAAGAGSTITCYLFNSDGIGLDTENPVTVYCTICGGVNLNSAIPRLEDDTEIFVVQLPYWTGSEIVQRWYCVSLFAASCVCEPDGTCAS